MKEVKYCDLQIGDRFKLTKNKNDNREYIKETEGAREIGYFWKIYPYYNMPVYVKGE